MKVEYSPRAADDLKRIGQKSRRVFGEEVAAALKKLIRASVARIGAMPSSGELLRQRQKVHVVSLVRYPFRIFYTVQGEVVTILHIRNTSRRAWVGSGPV
jgi:toxin ParE1/3/4